MDTLGSDVATVLAVYTGSDIFSLQEVASDVNDAPDGVRSLVKISAVPTNYLIAVDGVNGAQGNINLNWRMGIPPSAGGAAQKLVVTNGARVVLQAGQSNGVTAPFYQWQRNGTNLAGATNATYTIGALQYSQVGSYGVVVSNLVGSVTNAIALVNAQSPLTLSPSARGWQLNGSATQAVVLQASTNLALWTPLLTNTSPLLPISFLDTNSASRSKSFYRFQAAP